MENRSPGEKSLFLGDIVSEQSGAKIWWDFYEEDQQASSVALLRAEPCNYITISKHRFLATATVHDAFLPV